MFYLDGRPVTPERMETMSRAMAGWGPDNMDVRINGSSGLGFANLCTTPEGRYEKMPLTTPGSGTLLTAAARLDNRDELCELFGIQSPERPSMPDGRLVALAFERFGEETPRHLLGDWAFAAWDESNRRLFLARDHLGNTGLFYLHKPPLFAFASTPKALLALPEVPEILDEWHLARHLGLFQGEEEEWSDTFWKDIRLLLPSHSLSVTPLGLALRKYWSLDEAQLLNFAKDEEYLEGFIAHFRRAVRVRLRSNRPVGTQLSAGLDSGSVTALAAEALIQEGRTLPAFTSVPIYTSDHLVPGSLSDEWPMAHTVAQQYSNIEHIPIRAEGVSPLQAAYDVLALIGCPIHAAANMYWIQAIHQEAQRLGLGVLLTGQMGNGGVSWSGETNKIYYDLLNGRINHALRALKTYREMHGVSWYLAIRRHLLGPMLGPIWHRSQKLAQSREAPLRDRSAIHPDFARRIGIEDAMKRDRGGQESARRSSSEWKRRRIIEVNAPLWYIHHHKGAASRMDVRDPTGDVRLLMFCFGLPDEQFSRDGGERMLLRRAAAGVIPEKIRWNVVRGKQAADIGLRLMDYRQEMEDAMGLLEASTAASSYMDIGILRKVWKDLLKEVTPDTNRRAASILLRGVMAGLFIIRLSGHRNP